MYRSDIIEARVSNYISAMFMAKMPITLNGIIFMGWVDDFIACAYGEKVDFKKWGNDSSGMFRHDGIIECFHQMIDSGLLKMDSSAPEAQKRYLINLDKIYINKNYDFLSSTSSLMRNSVLRNTTNDMVTGSFQVSPRRIDKDISCLARLDPFFEAEPWKMSEESAADFLKRLLSVELKKHSDVSLFDEPAILSIVWNYNLRKKARHNDRKYGDQNILDWAQKLNVIEKVDRHGICHASFLKDDNLVARAHWKSVFGAAGFPDASSGIVKGGLLTMIRVSPSLYRHGIGSAIMGHAIARGCSGVDLSYNTPSDDVSHFLKLFGRQVNETMWNLDAKIAFPEISSSGPTSPAVEVIQHI